MSKSECEELIKAYLEWLRKGLSVERLEGACELTTPFLDRHNDHLQIYVEKKDGKIVLSDDGYILSDLRTSGLEVIKARRKEVLESILNGFGVANEQGKLVIEASQTNLGQRVHSLVQAMLAVNDMFVMAQPHVEAFFWEDVRQFFDDHAIRYSPRVKVPGRSGYDHAVDFLIPRSETRPERMVQAMNAPNKNTVTSYLFALTDIRKIRNGNSEAYAFLNDQDRAVGGDVTEALQAYEVKPVLWSVRDDYVEALAN